MESRQIRHFLAAFDTRSFAGAAEALGLSQQAISKSIAAFETQLGVRLFERDGRRLRATAYAELLLPHARTIAAESDRFRADLGDMLGGRRGSLRIGVGPSAAGEVVARATKIMASSRRHMRLSAQAGIYDGMLNDLLLGELDAVVAIRQTDRVDPLITEQEIGHIRYIVVAGADHPLAGKKGVTLPELAPMRWLAGANMGLVEREIEQSFRNAGVSPPTADIVSTSLVFSLAMLDGGDYLAIFPEMLLQRDLDIGRLVRIPVVDMPAWSRPLVTATRARGAKPPLLANFLDCLTQLLGEPA